jgi:phosphoribosylaminoimidazole-succinocarboxamide synthase
MKRRRMIYEGKAKILYEGPEPGTLIQYFKDDTTAFDATKKAVLDGKGVLNNRISEYLMTQLNAIGVPTHFVKRMNMREQLVKEVEIIPLEVIVRNVAAGSMSKRLGIEEGTVLPRSIIEYCYKNDALHDPLVSEEHITAFGWASPQDLDDIVNLTIRINDSSPACSWARASSWSISSWNSAGCGKTTICASCWRTRSARTIAGCGTSTPTKNSTRTVSAATWAA